MAQPDHLAAASSPVQTDEPDKLEPGVALCLSGGGYRAMLFHVGAIWRLNELGYLAEARPRLERLRRLDHCRRARPELAPARVRRRRRRDQPRRAVRPAASEARVEDDRPGRRHPRHPPARHDLRPRRRRVSQARLRRARPSRTCRTSRGSSSTRPTCRPARSGDSRSPTWPTTTVGMVRNPEVELAVAVAASSAFPPILSPARAAASTRRASIRPRAGRCTSAVHDRRRARATAASTTTSGSRPPGSATRTILVSDGGGKMGPQPKPKHDWARHAYRALGVIDTQVRNLRKRQVVAGYLSGDRQGTYWGIRSHIGDYGPPAGSLPCPDDEALRLAQTATRLKADGRHAARAAHQLGLRDLRRRHAEVGRAGRPGARRLPVSRGRRRLESAATCQSTGSRFRAPSFGTCACSRSIPA